MEYSTARVSRQEKVGEGSGKGRKRFEVEVGQDLARGVVVRRVGGDAAEQREGGVDLPLLHLHLRVRDGELALLRGAGELEHRALHRLGRLRDPLEPKEHL